MSDVILSIDCSNRWSCLGLAVDGKIAGERNLDLGRAQAARLPLLVAELLGCTYGTLRASRRRSVPVILPASASAWLTLPAWPSPLASKWCR